MQTVHLNNAYVESFCDIESVRPDIEKAAQTLMTGTGPGSEYLGWLTLPQDYDKDEYARIKRAAEHIRKDADALIVVGIGGSYLGTRAVIEAQKGDKYNELSRERRGGPQIYYAGNNLSSESLDDLLHLTEGKSVYVNVISKSGTTLEPAAAFRVLMKNLEGRYSAEELQKRVIATTDSEKGALKALANEKGYETFVVPDSIGGRYSVLTAVGLLPIAVAGIDIDELMHGARDGMKLFDAPYDQNPCYQYAAARTALYRKGYKIEVLTNYKPGWHYFSEWWKQLFGESEGKDGKGLYPSSMDFTTDLHSLGQYVQDGERHLFKTALKVEKLEDVVSVPRDDDNHDGLNYLAGKPFGELNRAAQDGTIQAHKDGGVPQMIITTPVKDAYALGQLIFFFEKACAVSAYALGVNPFDQPGVEAYKENMFKLLGKEAA